MFKKKKVAKMKEEIQEKPVIKEIQELAEENQEPIVEETQKGEIPVEDEIPEEPEEVEEETIDDQELTEEMVINYLQNVQTALSDMHKRIHRIEHHLRLDFD